MKVNDLIDQYEQGAKLRGLAPTQLNALKPIRRALGEATPAKLTPGAIDKYVSRRRDGWFTNAFAAKGAANGTIRRELGALSSVLNWGVQKHLIKDAPSIDLPPTSPPRENFLDKGAADALWDYAADEVRDGDFIDRKVGLFTCLALDTWARANSIETLPWSRVTLGSPGRIDYRDPARPETAKRRVPVPISTRLRDVLLTAGVADPDGALVTGPITQYAWRSFTSEAGFPDLTRHDLRRTGISLAVARGVDLMKVAQMAGDNYDTVLKHYARFAPDYLDGVVT